MKNKADKIVAIVPAAGFGKRFGKEKNKPLYSLNGKPMVVWVLEMLQGVEEIDEIVPVFKEEDLLSGAELVETYNISKARRIVCGGRERQDSVNNAVSTLDDNTSVVVVHDGARPLVDRELFRMAISSLKGVDGVVAGVLRLINEVRKSGAAILAVPVKDTIKETDRLEGQQTGVIVKRTLDRSLLWAIQTPQVFNFRKLKDAYEKACSEGFYATDDSALIERYGGKIRIIEGSYRNIKITTPDDIIIAEALLSASGC